MTRTQFTRIGALGAALAAVGVTMTNRPAHAFWAVTTRSIACWTVGCPAAPGAIKCAEITLAIDGKIGSGSVTYFCYLSETSEPDVRGGEEM